MVKSRGLLNPYRALKRRHPAFPSCRGVVTLAIETSCDDTSVAILEKHGDDDDDHSHHARRPGATLHFHERITANNTKRKGIDPVRALSSHASNLAVLVDRSLKSLPRPACRHPESSERRQKHHLVLQDGTQKVKPDFITVTRGPGMRSSLSCGLDTAKGLCVGWQIPLLAVHHMQAHALTPRLVHALSSDSTTKPSDPQPCFPFVSLLVSGGHTLLLHSRTALWHQTVAASADIAIGEALDKIGRLILPAAVQASLPDVAYAKHLSDYAFPTPDSYIDRYRPPESRGDECIRAPSQYGWEITVPFTDRRTLRFSFSGIASQVERIFNQRSPLADFSEAERLALARTALTTAFNHLGSRTVIALQELGRQAQHQHQTTPTINTLVVSGGVAANPVLRHVLRRFLDVRGFGWVRLVFPPVELCTDNAAMIGWLGMEMWQAGWRSRLGVRAVRRWSMDSGVAMQASEREREAEREVEEEGGAVGGGVGCAGVLGVGGWYNVHADHGSV